MAEKGRISFVGIVLLTLLLCLVQMLFVFVRILFEAPSGLKLIWSICGILLSILFILLVIVVAFWRLARVAPPAGYTEDTFHNVIWRWHWHKSKPVISGCFCSWCEAPLEPMAVPSWQADLKCSGCGKTFASLPGYVGNAKSRTYAQTQKEIHKMITKQAYAKISGQIRVKA